MERLRESKQSIARETTLRRCASIRKSWSKEESWQRQQIAVAAQAKLLALLNLGTRTDPTITSQLLCSA